MNERKLSSNHIEIIKRFLKHVHKDDLSRAHIELEAALHDLELADAEIERQLDLLYAIVSSCGNREGRGWRQPPSDQNNCPKVTCQDIRSYLWAYHYPHEAQGLEDAS